MKPQYFKTFQNNFFNSFLYLTFFNGNMKKISYKSVENTFFFIIFYYFLFILLFVTYDTTKATKITEKNHKQNNFNFFLKLTKLLYSISLLLSFR